MMKSKHLFYVGLILLVVSFAFAGCKKEDEKQQTVGGARQAAGEYHGKLDIYAQEMSSVEIPSVEDIVIRIEAQTDDVATVTLPEILYDSHVSGSQIIHSIDVPNVRITTEGDDVYTIHATDYETSVDSKTYAGRLKGSLEKGTLSLQYSIRVGKMPVTLIVTYSPY